MTQVVLRAKYPTAGSSYGKVWVDLIGTAGSPAGGLDTGGRAVVYRSVTGRLSLSNTGEITLELQPTNTLLPAGLVYRASFQKAGSPVPETLVFAGFTGVGPVYATDYIVELPGDLPSGPLAAHIANGTVHFVQSSTAPTPSLGVIWLDISVAPPILKRWDGAQWVTFGGAGGGGTGTNGLSVLSGAGAPSALLGVNGEHYIDTVAKTIYGPKTAGVWGSPTALIGPAGAAGAAGAAGPAGSQGPAGAQGAAGAQGTPGTAGAQGPAGPTGNTGPAGPSGVVTATSPLAYNAGTQTVSVAVGTGTGTVAAGNDARFSDARTPTAHAASHVFGAADALTLTEAQITNLVADLLAKASVASVQAGYWAAVTYTAGNASTIARPVGAHVLWFGPGSVLPASFVVGSDAAIDYTAAAGTGSQAAETDTGVGGTASGSGARGTTAVEADTAASGTASGGSGSSTATEVDTANAGTAQGSGVRGTQATEADTGQAGTVGTGGGGPFVLSATGDRILTATGDRIFGAASFSAASVVTGNTATEADTGTAGTASGSGALGSTATEANTAAGGTAQGSGAGGATASETDTPSAGTSSGSGAAGSTATETDTAQGSSGAAPSTGARITDTGAFRVTDTGAFRTTASVGTQATETDTPSAGTAQGSGARGTTATEADTAAAGSAAGSGALGSTATETDTGTLGTAQGSGAAGTQATEVDTAAAGTASSAATANKVLAATGDRILTATGDRILTAA